MAWTRMSEREVRRVEVLNEVQSGRRTVTAAASVLDISERKRTGCWPGTRRTEGSGWCTKPGAHVEPEP